jgi:hypothetical protein
VSELAREVQLLKQKVGKVDSIRIDIGLALASVSLLAVVPNPEPVKFLDQSSALICTFAKTEPTFIDQPVWMCRTCGLVNEKGCCAACAHICHRGHDVYFNPSIRDIFYCDCGAGDGARPCLCLR